jgi:hypothetical protein
METGITVINRMGDVMLALAEAEGASIHPTKIQLQKFAYLADILGQVIGLLQPTEGHKTYRNGPYDPAIQNAVDALAFRGLARVTGIWKVPNGRLASSYALAEPGREFLAKLRNHPAFARKVQVARLIGGELINIGWNRIVSLVYAEPTFVTTRPTGWGSRLEADNGLTVSAAFLMAIMRRAAGTLSSERPVPPEWITGRFFAYMSDYDRRYGPAREATL